jgi:heat shock protein HslJ
VAETAAQPPAEWRLSAVVVRGEPAVWAEQQLVTLVVGDDEISGLGPCNHYFGSRTDDGLGNPSFGDIRSTAMGCAGHVEAAESQYLELLARVTEIDVVPDVSLRLRGPGFELSFTPIPPVPIDGIVDRTWSLTAIVQGGVAVSPAVAAALELTSGGSIVATTGCRTLSGEYRLTGSKVIVVRLEAAGTCPDALVAQDGAILSGLEVFFVEHSGDRLTVRAWNGPTLEYAEQPQ